MSFSDKDKRILIEVVNHIHHAYASDQAFTESETTSITLPARLVRLSADVVVQSYRPEILSGLEKAEIELLLTSLFKAIDAMTTALQAVMTALPGESPAWVRDQFDQQLQSIAALTALKSAAQAVPATRPLIESGKETPSEKPEPADLRQRYEELSQAQEALSQIDLEKLREDVFELEATIGPRRQEAEELQRTVSDKTTELEKLTDAISEAEQILQIHDENAREQLDHLLDITSNLVTALDPFLSKGESRIREAVETLSEKVCEGRQLKADLLARINEISEVLEETLRISAGLSLYAEANDRVVRTVPTVVNLTREKLTRIEEQLREIDADLKQALVQHQSAKHAAEVARI
jgi:hypothetical protein